MSILIVGTSCCLLFSLIDDSNIQIKHFKGASILGLIKSDNENREQIKLLVEKYNLSLKKIIFYFGTVDIHFSYFYNLIYRNRNLLTDINLNFEIISKKYIDFIDSLKCNCEKIIIGPSPSTLLNEFEIYDRLIMYHIINKQDFPTLNSIDESIVLNFSKNNQIKVFKTLNKYLNKYCQQKYKFINLSSICLNKKGVIKKKFIHKYNKLNIHLNWEPLIKPLSLACGFKKIKLKKSLKYTQNVFYSKRKQRNNDRYTRKKNKYIDKLNEQWIKQIKQNLSL